MMNNHIKQAVETIKVPEIVHEHARKGARRAAAEQSGRGLKRKLLVAAVAGGITLGSTGAAAAYIPSVNQLLSLISPEAALLLQPIEETSTDKDITMNVLAAMSDGEMAVMYLTLKDVKEDRIDETLDLYDYALSGAELMGSELLNYDPNSKTATIRVQANGGAALEGKKVKFTVHSFLSDKETHVIPLDLKNYAKTRPHTVNLDQDMISGIGGDLYPRLAEQSQISVLRPDELNKDLSGVDFMRISNAGAAGGRFHIQTKWTGRNVDSHGEFYYVKDGKEIYASSVRFSAEKGKPVYGTDYEDYIFASAEEPIEYPVFGRFVSNGKHTQGNWQTTFRLEPVQTEWSQSYKKAMGNWQAEEIAVSPLGVTIRGTGSHDGAEPEVQAQLKSGQRISFDSMMRNQAGDRISVKYTASRPLEVADIAAVYVDGEKLRVE